MLQRLMVFLGGGAVQGWLEQAPVVVLMRRPDGSLLEPSLEWIVGPQKFAVLHLLLLLCFEKYMPDGWVQQCSSAIVYVALAVVVHNPLQKNEHCKPGDISIVLVAC